MSPKIGAFTLQRRLGKGGMGEVWLATHDATQINVALKLMTAEQTKEERYRESFAREVRAVARLDHPAIVRVFDTGEAGPGDAAPQGTPYLVMELAMGTLREMAGQLTRWSQHRTILLRILDALAHAHARGVIHRDLKPENILLVSTAEGPRLKLADFGLAHAYLQSDDPHNDREWVTGTPRFMAPEQILGQWRDQGPWTDLYAVGCLAYWLTNGSPPYSGTTTEEILQGHLQGELPPLRAQTPLPPKLHLWFEQIMARKPRDRFQLAADAAYTLNQLALTEEQLQELETAPPSPAPQPPRSQTPQDTVLIDNSGVEPTLLLDEPLSHPGPPEPAEPLPAAKLPPIPDTWEAPAPRAMPQTDDKLRGVGLGLFGLRQLSLVGRRAERDALWDALRLVHSSGESFAICLQGTMGVGKTSLARWLAERSLELGAANLAIARHSPIEAPTHGLATLIANQLRAHGLTTEAIVARIRDAFAHRSPLNPDDLYDCIALAELIAPICATDHDPSRTRTHLSSPGERHALICRFLARTADKRPILLILDDAHWGHDTLEFARFLLANPKKAPPTLIILTLRNEALEHQPLEREALAALKATPGCETLDVAPLNEEEHRLLVQDLLGLQSDLVEDVVQRTRGNPLFAIQLVGDWVERQILVPTATGFRLKSGANVRLPDDIYHLLTTRLDQIAHRLSQPTGTDPDQIWQCLELASALGREVNHREWYALCHEAGLYPPRGLVSALSLARQATSDEYCFTFLHGAIRESIQSHAEKNDRWKSHHELCARTLERLYPPKTRGLSSRIGRHLAIAHRWDLAHPHLLAGADEARVAGEFNQAYDLFDRHLEAVEKAGGKELHELSVLNAIRRARTETNHNLLHLAQPRLKAIENLDISPLLHAERLFAQGTLARSLGQFSQGIAIGKNCVDAYLTSAKDFDLTAPEHAPLAVATAKAHALYADFLLALGHIEEAYDQCLASLQLSTSSKNESAAAQMQLGNILLIHGDFDDALDWLKKARALAEEVGNRYLLAQIENSFGEAHRGKGEPGRALDHYQTALTLLHRLGVAQLGTVHFNIAICLVEEQKFSEAEPYFHKVHQTLTALGNKGYLGISHLGLATCAGARGDWTAWQNHLDHSQTFIDQAAIVLPDIPILATAAMHLASAANRPDDADRLRQLAISQWTKLQRFDDAAKLTN